MNLSAIKKCCLTEGRFIILNCEGGEQWICNGSSAWPIDGVELHAGGVPALFDLTAKQANECYIDEHDCEDWRFSRTVDREREQLLEDVGAIWHRGELYRAAKGDFGTVFLPVSAMKPVKVKDYCEFYAREEDRRLLVAVYPDLFCAALIAPMDAKTAEAIRTSASIIAAQQLWLGAEDESEEQ